MENNRWSAQQAWDWYNARPWQCGFNYVPSTAINPIELSARETFDPAAIDRELGLAERIGFNSLRINLHYFAHEADAAGLLDRIDRFLGIADSHGLSAMFCLFDDCSHFGKQPHHGRQDPPVPGVHNSGWTPSPGHAMVKDPSTWPKLRQYVAGVVGRFAQDRRVLLWDLYNEPGNSGMGEQSVPLLRETFAWRARSRRSSPFPAACGRAITASRRPAVSPKRFLSFPTSSRSTITRICPTSRARSTSCRPRAARCCAPSGCAAPAGASSARTCRCSAGETSRATSGA